MPRPAPRVPPATRAILPASDRKAVPPGVGYRRSAGAGGVALLDVVVEELEELGDDGVALERELERAVHEDGRPGLLGGARQRDPDVGVLGFAGTVDHAAHHRDLQLLHARVASLP